MGQEQGFRSFLRVLRNRNFRWLWISQVISVTGDFFSFLAVPYLITVLAEGREVAGVAVEGGEMSPETKALVGLAATAFALPRLLGIFTGVFVDRWNRHRTMIAGNVVAAALVLIPLLVVSLDDVWLLIGMQFALALTTRFIQPTQQAALPQLLDEEDLLAANGLTMVTLTIGMIVGPMLAGGVVELFGPKAAFLVDSGSFLVAALSRALRVRIPRLENAPGGQGMRAILGNIGEGVRFLFGTSFLLATLICFVLLQGGLGGINAMWVPFLRETFDLGPLGITMVDTAQGIGMALGAVALGLLMARLSKLAIAAVGAAGIGLAIVGMGLAPAFGVVLAMGAVVGLLLVPVDSVISTLLQLAVPKELQGRVFGSLFALTQAASVAIMALVTALVATLPLRLIFVGGGLAILIAGLAWTFLVREDVRTLDARGVAEDSVGSAAAVAPIPGD